MFQKVLQNDSQATDVINDIFRRFEIGFSIFSIMYTSFERA